MRQCTKCNKNKIEHEFYKDKKGKNGLSYWCKECVKENSRKNSKTRTEKLREERKNRKVEYYPNIVCGCGCGGKIQILPSHKINGIPKFAIGHNKKNKKYGSKYGAIDLTQEKYCECGCGEKIKILPHHLYTGIPKFIQGHKKQIYNKGKSKYPPLDKDIKKLCKCGCGEYIQIKDYHIRYGIPDYIAGHQCIGKSCPPLSEERKLYLSIINSGLLS